jgi:hypothetical protein
MGGMRQCRTVVERGTLNVETRRELGQLGELNVVDRNKTLGK